MQLPVIAALILATSAALFAAEAKKPSIVRPATAEIPHPDDAQKPFSPAGAAKSFHLPPGCTMKLIAAEPLINEPSGVCWDERGRMFVCELHGCNVEGQ